MDRANLTTHIRSLVLWVIYMLISFISGGVVLHKLLLIWFRLDALLVLLLNVGDTDLSAVVKLLCAVVVLHLQKLLQLFGLKVTLRLSF